MNCPFTVAFVLRVTETENRVALRKQFADSVGRRVEFCYTIVCFHRQEIHLVFVDTVFIDDTSISFENRDFY